MSLLDVYKCVALHVLVKHISILYSTPDVLLVVDDVLLYTCPGCHWVVGGLLPKLVVVLHRFYIAGSSCPKVSDVSVCVVFSLLSYYTYIHSLPHTITPSHCHTITESIFVFCPTTIRWRLVSFLALSYGCTSQPWATSIQLALSHTTSGCMLPCLSQWGCFIGLQRVTPGLYPGVKVYRKLIG